jgi:hypothetical protein
MASAQTLAGGALQLTPAQGSPAHWPLAQPAEHVVIDSAYEHFPASQVPDAE